MKISKYYFFNSNILKRATVLAVVLLLLVIFLTTGCFASDIDNIDNPDYSSEDLSPSFSGSILTIEDLNGGEYYPGDKVRASVYLKNSGTGPAKNIKIKLETDDFLTIPADDISWDLESLPVGEAEILEIDLKIIEGIEVDSKASLRFSVSSGKVDFTGSFAKIDILGVKEYSRNFIPIIGLHAIEDEIDIPIELSTENFEFLCSTLKKFSYQTITLNDLLEYIDYGRALPDKAVIITSDDGYQDNYLNAFPILKKYGYTMTVFLVTGAIAENDQMRMDNKVFNDRTNTIRPMLSWLEIKEMHDYGCEFLSHTVNHIRLGLASDEEVLNELIISREDIEDHIGKPVSFFSWPYDNYSEDKWPLIEKAGYRGAVRYWGGIEDLREINLYNIKRVEFNSYVSPAEYAGYLGLFDISISSDIKRVKAETGSEFKIKYIIKNNEKDPINISSLELEIPDNIELIEVIENGNINQFPALSDGIFMWVGDSYFIEAESSINIILRLKSNKSGEIPIKFRITAYDAYIRADDIDCIITD